MAFRTSARGELVADGSEQPVLEISKAGRFSGYVTLRNMLAGDTVVMKQYFKVGGQYDVYWAETYTGAQENPVQYVTPKESVSGMKVTLEQSAGTLRTFPFEFIVEELPGVKTMV